MPRTASSRPVAPSATVGSADETSPLGTSPHDVASDDLGRERPGATAPAAAPEVAAGGTSAAGSTGPATTRQVRAGFTGARRSGTAAVGPVPPPPAVSIRVPPVVSTTSAARFAERAKLRRTIARRQVIGLTSGLAAIAALAWLLLWSPVLALDADRLQVEIQGPGSVVASDEVRDVVAARHGTPLPRLDVGAIRQDVLDVPGVREASVSRDWPHGLTVSIVAREPVAAVPAQGRSGYSLLDEQGVQVGHVRKAPATLPVVAVPTGDERTLRAVLEVVHELPAELSEQVASISARTQDTVSMDLRGGLRVDWGSSADATLKIAVLTTLLGSDAVEDATVVDVSAPRMPIVR